MDELLRLIRYNTGTDKKAFVEFKDKFDAVVFNASIVAYNGAAISDIISIHMNHYIIDPQTYILQHGKEAFLSSKGTEIKASVKKYLDELPSDILEIIDVKQRSLEIQDIIKILGDFCKKVYDFQTTFINRFLQEKEYNKYLDFALEEEGKEAHPLLPKVLIAPYFRLKKTYDENEISDWLNLNGECLQSFIDINQTQLPVAAELLIDKELLPMLNYEDIRKTYSNLKCEYVFVWIDEFIPSQAKIKEQEGFKKLIDIFNEIGIKPIMAYGGYDSILLCHRESKTRLYGVAQSVGYGESRPITPVGGGLPINKYYFNPLHKRLSFGDVTTLLNKAGFFHGDKNAKKDSAERFYLEVCDCLQCKEIINSNIDNFNVYNTSVPYTWKGDIKRNRPTAEASFFAARHFMYCKIKEWESLGSSLNELCDKLLDGYIEYGERAEIALIRRYISFYVK